MTTEVMAVREHKFLGEDCKEVTGSYFYLKITQDDGRVDTRRVFIGEDRLTDFAYIPKSGDKVLVFASNGKVVDMLKSK
ncbi:MAG: hypothetical protein PUB51_02505 [Oscillospiraceae bacterium]|nr:hypothetical protein [Oscillospiraceae bacterium]